MNDLVVDLAWAAGFFDAEGHVGKHKYSTIVNIVQCIEIDNTAPEVLTRFLNIVRLGKINGPYEHKNKKWRPFYQYYLGDKPSVIQLYKLLYPYLSSVKRAQFIGALNISRLA